MNLKPPRLIAADSSILALWAQDAFSDDSDLRAAARTAQTDLLQANWIPIICLHHFIELGRHSDVKVGTIRFDFLKSFPQIAWLGRSYDPTLLGAIVDVFEAEVATIAAFPGLSFSDMRDSVRAKLLRYSPPSDIKALSDWVWLHPTLEAMARHEQEVASIIHAHQSDHDDMKISELKKVRINRTTLNLSLIHI